MSDKYTQPSGALNPLIQGDDSWKFATAQFSEVCDPELVPPEAGLLSCQKRSRKSAAQRQIPVPPETPLGDIVVLIQMIDPRVDLFADVRQFRHQLFRGEGNKFLRLGRRDTLKNEVSLQNLLPTLTATGPFRHNGLAGRLSPVRAVRRCGLASHGAVPGLYFVTFSDSWQRAANGSALVAILRVCNTCENSSEGAYPVDPEQRKIYNLRVLNTARLFESLFLRQFIYLILSRLLLSHAELVASCHYSRGFCSKSGGFGISTHPKSIC